jgi:uncharacterized protein YggE
MTKPFLCLLIATFMVATFLAAAPSSRAQEAGATIAASGSATLKQPPTLLRLTIGLSGKGKTLKDAIAALEDRRTAAQTQLKTLGADQQSIHFTDTTIGAEGSQREQLQQAMFAMRRGGRPLKGLQVPESAAVACELTAEWPLTAKNATQLLLASKELQDKIAAADLAGLKSAKSPTPAEEEIDEELSGANYPGQETEAKPGEPSFLYVRKFTADEQSQALAEAFGHAKEEAQRLAAAAGLKLGELVELKGGGAGAQDDEYGYAYQMMQRRRGGAATSGEGVSPQLGPVSLNFHVEARFRTK